RPTVCAHGGMTISAGPAHEKSRRNYGLRTLFWGGPSEAAPARASGMAETTLNPLLQHIRGLVGAREAGASTDDERLRRFVARRDEAAFAALVERHGRLVLRVCRHLLGHEQEAEDAFQATFLVLARRAAAVCRYESLAGWLHGVACRTALNA